MDSKKIILFEIDKTKTLPDNLLWVLEDEDLNIWQCTYATTTVSRTSSYGYGAYGYLAYGSTDTKDVPDLDYLLDLSALFIDKVKYVKYYSVASLIDQSFYYDLDAVKLYVRLPVGTEPSDYTLWESNISTGFSNFEGEWDFSGTGHPVFYDGRVDSIPGITYKKDSTYYSIVSFDGGNVNLLNTDGYFDELESEDVFGQEVRIRYSSDGGDTFQVVYTGYFESFQLTGKMCVVSIYDKRKTLSTSIPDNYFSDDDYPYLNDSNKGIPIPLGFGKIHLATCICLNEEEDPVPTNYSFKICDNIYPIQSLDNVFFEGTEVTPQNVNLNTCTFTLPSSVYEKGKTVSANYHGYVVNGSLLENPIKILEFILERWAGIAKSDYNYNLTEWNSCRDKPGIPMIGYHIATQKNMIDVIGDISNSVFGTFLIQKDGLITFKIRDINKTPVATITADEYIISPKHTYGTSEYANIIRVGHSKAWSNGKHSYVTIDTLKDDLFEKYRINSTKEVQTLITNKADATTYGDSLYLQFAGIFPTFVLTTKTQYLNLALEDLIEAQVYILPDGSLGSVILEVLGVDANLNDNIVTITARFIRYSGLYSNKKLIRWESPK